MGTATPRVPPGRAAGQRAELGGHVRPTVVLLGPTKRREIKVKWDNMEETLGFKVHPPTLKIGY